MIDSTELRILLLMVLCYGNGWTSARRPSRTYYVLDVIWFVACIVAFALVEI